MVNKHKQSYEKRRKAFYDRRTFRKKMPGWSWNEKNVRYYNRRQEQRWGFKFRQLAEMPYYNRTYNGDNFMIEKWGPTQHHYVWSRQVSQVVPRYQPPRVVDTSQGRPRGLVPSVDTHGALPSSWFQQPLPYEYQNKDWTINTPFRLPWPSNTEVEKPVPGRPDYVTFKKGGLQYYRNRHTMRIEYVIPRWDLPLQVNFPGGREWSTNPFRPPRWFNIADKIGRILLPSRFEPQDGEEDLTKKHCRKYDAIRKIWIPCTQKTIQQAYFPRSQAGPRNRSHETRQLRRTYYPRRYGRQFRQSSYYTSRGMSGGPGRRSRSRWY